MHTVLHFTVFNVYLLYLTVNLLYVYYLPTVCVLFLLCIYYIFTVYLLCFFVYVLFWCLSTVFYCVSIVFVLCVSCDFAVGFHCVATVFYCFYCIPTVLYCVSIVFTGFLLCIVYLLYFYNVFSVLLPG